MGIRSDRKNAKKPSSAGERRLTVKEEDQLLAFLLKALINEQSKTSIKSFLKNGQVSVNNEVTTQFDRPLSPNDLVTIYYGIRRVVFSHPLLKIIWEDDELMVVQKKQGLLSVANPKVKDRTAYQLLSDYVKQIDPQNKIFILHRLEKDVSGLMIFAKQKAIQVDLHAHWNQLVTNRTFIAVVEGRPRKEQGLLTSFGTDEVQSTTYITSADSGSETILRYRRLRSNETYSLLELMMESGHKNYIREQMRELGTPIAGDFKYGAQTDPIGRVALHANKLFFIHPVTNEEMRFEMPIPSSFVTLVKK
ncbi:MAG: pseudouridine synthase [Massilibacteroides sp.]|nr:pseudouridine synthase [Massilibacteroides sp.]MDD3061799.1 pseudouridine synthase [Massilibacteroides sp.]MDD4115086.1 pseudouridine synthase [Massilibacteroides sp.]MDD4660081.1 pseudouridine synthase [Massilibacteroides sp.]